MKKNPKTIIGAVLVAVLLAGLGILLTQLIPTVQELQYERSLTPTPLPPAPDTVRANGEKAADIPAPPLRNGSPASVMAVTPDPAAPTQEPILRTGSEGEAVKNLQGRLYTLGYYQGEIDGQFGPATKEAVQAFQRQNGLEADGIVGGETRQILFSAEAKPKQ